MLLRPPPRWLHEKMTAELCSEQDRETAEARDDEMHEWSSNAWVDTDATDQEVAMSTPFLPSALAWQSIPSRSSNGSSLNPRSPNRFYLLCRAIGVWACLLSLGALILLLIVRSSLPVFEEQDRDALRIPRNFHQLQALNNVLQNYSHRYFFRVLIAWTAIDLFMMPVPPDFMLNIMAPHLGVEIKLFWLSCLLGVISMTLIHTAIGEELNEMTSSDDFRFFSGKNVAIMLCIGAAMILPMLLKRYVQSPEDSLSQQGAIHLNTHASPLREWIRTRFYKLMKKIDPSWGYPHPSRQPNLDSASDQDEFNPETEHSSWPSTDWDESMTAWRQEADPTSPLLHR
ncbi:hypothetical protein MYAM1_003185 [Malassezia yamatoensis]|uniref:Golgi apparatus membrane protein TVP38 n=1 Tax=Malassezia yamatoensis TaxID=253288 RepID=A0AAJ6CIM9_9BASI|nr:hypothetical protein MYAM1_003185 [Malassezia yamatoensis]